MERKIEYEANDGTRFETREECRQHDRKLKLASLLHLDEANLLAAIEREDIALADAIEFAGTLIAEKRRQSGELRRNAKAAK
jgi:hypothetical protein